MSCPRWVSKDYYYNLREIAPHLYIGAEGSPKKNPEGEWGLIVDWYGISRGKPGVLSLPFNDGLAFPRGVLDLAFDAVSKTLSEGKPVLIHCQAGLSRSASSAYAMIRVIYGLTHEEALARVQIRSDFPRKDTLASARAWVHRKRRSLSGR